MSDDLAMWLTQIWDEQELIAREASRHNEERLVEGGAHWLWACDEHDETVTPDPLTKDILACPQDFWRVSLRSVERYPYRSISGEGPTISFAAEEVPSSVGLHILRHDPAAVLAQIAADRQILADYEDHVSTYRNDPTPFGEGQRFGLLLALARLASAYADRPGYNPEWRP